MRVQIFPTDIPGLIDVVSLDTKDLWLDLTMGQFRSLLTSQDWEVIR